MPRDIDLVPKSVLKNSAKYIWHRSRHTGNYFIPNVAGLAAVEKKSARKWVGRIRWTGYNYEYEREFPTLSTAKAWVEKALERRYQ